MGSPSVIAVKGPAPATRQGANEHTRAAPKPHVALNAVLDTIESTIAPPSCSLIPALAPGESGSSPTPGGDVPPLFLQRKCAACAQEEEEVAVQRQPSGVAEPLWLLRKCATCDTEEDDVELQRKPSVNEARSSVARVSKHERLVRDALAHSQGEPLLPVLRTEMERAYGVELGNVRIHRDALANRASEIVAAHAFTAGQSIYFATGQYQPTTRAGRELLAHELAHVVQNRHQNTAVPARKRSLLVSEPHDPAEVEADAAAQAVTAGQPFRVRGSGRATLHRKDILGQAVDWGKTKVDQAESAAAEGVEAAVKYTGAELMQLVRTVAPELAAILDEGPETFAKRKASEALDAHLPDALGGFSVNDLIKGVTSWFGEAGSFVKNLAKGGADACKSFADFMHKLSGFVGKLIDNPVTNAITGALNKVTDFVGKVLKVVAAPIFDELSELVSGAWSVLKVVASTISGWFTAAKNALGNAWTGLMKLLGFDGSSEDGVWKWIKEAAAKVWDSIKAVIAPAMAPLKKVLSVVAMLTPIGPIYAIIKYGPKLVKVVQWIWENGLSPEKIREAPAEIRGMLESLSSNVDGFKSVLKTGMDWLSEKLSALSDAILETGTAVSGLPLLSFSHNLFDSAHQALSAAVTDVEKDAREAFAAVVSAEEKANKFITPYKEVISSLILAIAAPPTIPVILAGWAWRALPTCVKVPILDFILDIAIKAIAKIPVVPTFDLLWPLLKPGVLGFLETLRAAPDDVKEKVSSKIAKLMSGASPAFLIAFVKGFAQGVWEGVTDPLKAIVTVLEGLDTVTEYLLSLAGFDEKQTPAPATESPAARSAEGEARSGDMSEAKKTAGEAAQSIGPDVQVVQSGFWDAVQEYFNGKSMTFNEMIQRLSSTWEAAKAKIHEGGAWLATQMTQFFGGSGESNETTLGDKVGWLSGTVVFQVVLDAITAGTWQAAGPLLKSIAKFINWPMEAMGEVFKIFKSLGKFLLDGIKSMGSAVKESASGAFRAVSKAIGHIGETLIELGERILGKVGGKAAKVEAKAVGAIEKEGARLGERETAKLAGAGKDGAAALEGKAGAGEARLPHETETKLPREGEPNPLHDTKPKEPIVKEPTVKEPAGADAAADAEGKAAKKTETEAAKTDTGHIESEKLTPSQLHNETEMLAEHPNMVEGTPPHRRAQVGEHEWIEEPAGNGECVFCRHSKPVCVKTPELRAAEMSKAESRVTRATEQAQKDVDDAALKRMEADTHPELSEDWRKFHQDEFEKAEARATAAQKQLPSTKAQVTRATNLKDAERLKAAQSKLEKLEKEVALAEKDAAHAKQILGARDTALAEAKAAEDLAAASKKEVTHLEDIAQTQRNLVKDIEAKEAEIQRLHAATKGHLPTLNSKEGKALSTAEANLAKAREDLVKHIEGAQGMSPELKEGLRKTTPFGGMGGAERESDWIKGLPPSAKGPNGTYIDYVTGEALPLNRLSPDHIVPVNEILDMEDFAKLSRKDQREILDLPENLKLLERDRNSSKQAQPLKEWLGSKKPLAPKLDMGKRTELHDLETKARKSLQEEIQKRLQRMRKP